MSGSVLMVAEKPSLALALARILSRGSSESRGGVTRTCPVHEFTGEFPVGSGHQRRIKVTSVVGHVFSADFPDQYRSWSSCEPVVLFDVPVERKVANPKARITKHLQVEAKDAAHVVLWLDCDREGESIAFEVLQCIGWKHTDSRVHRAKFSAVTDADVRRAMSALIKPNLAEAQAVDVRQELDLKMGVAMSRLITQTFTSAYGDLDARLLSYGPCQTPALGLVVARHDMIQRFEPEPYWSLHLRVGNPDEGGDTVMELQWAQCARMFHKDVAVTQQRVLQSALDAGSPVAVERVHTSDARKSPPQPLNTVAMLRLASSRLGFSPQRAMQMAERLYLQGYMSYPRTESTAFPSTFNAKHALEPHAHSPIWGAYVRSLIEMGPRVPTGGVDMGDHPPITPLRDAREEDVGGDMFMLFEMVTRMFIASLSPPCVYARTKARIGASGFSFKLSGSLPKEPGFTLIVPWMSPSEVRMPHLCAGQQLSGCGASEVAQVVVKEGRTSPPPYLSESDLLELMEKHQIGTDASMAGHVSTLSDRNYAQVGKGRTLIPTRLGIALVHGLQRVDAELVASQLRASIESWCAMVAANKVDHETVLRHSLATLKAKFVYFMEHIEEVDSLFSAVFTPIAQTEGKPFSLCGHCRKYMLIIRSAPTRLYCRHCELTYALPQRGAIKLYKDLKCPLDGFGLVKWSAGPGCKSYPLCPMCYSSPPGQAEAPMGCDSCTIPSCQHSLVFKAITSCPESGCNGSVALDVDSAPAWRAYCNACSYAIFFVDAHKVTITDNKCPMCWHTILAIDWKKGTAPLGPDNPVSTGCIQCDPVFEGRVHDGHTRHTHGRRKKKGKGRGRGRGRGGRKQTSADVDRFFI